MKEDEENNGKLRASPFEPKNYIDSLPNEILCLLFRMLSVINRLNCERVSHRWKSVVQEFGWTEQKILNAEIVFQGASDDKRSQFRPQDLISLLNRVTGPMKNPNTNNLLELHLHSFYAEDFDPFAPEIAESLKFFSKLEKLNIRGFDLVDFVGFLPSTLRVLKISGDNNIQMLETLSEKCPNLEKVPFQDFDDINDEIMNGYLLKFPRQKVLIDPVGPYPSHQGSLSAISGLRDLEVLKLWEIVKCDDKTLEAIAAECTKLRQVRIRCTHGYSETDMLPVNATSLFLFAKLPNLTVLEVWNDIIGAFTDEVLISIAQRGKLKRLMVPSKMLTDDSIVYLINRCKSLISLDLCQCSQITDRSLEAVITEVQRRHGSPPQSLPIGPQDLGIFYFDCQGTEIDMEDANELAAGNPWLRLASFINDVYDGREII